MAERKQRGKGILKLYDLIERDSKRITVSRKPRNNNNNILTAVGSVSNTTLEISIVVSDGVATDQTSFLLTILGNLCEDEYSQGFLDGSATGDVNGDGTLNIVDIVQSIDMILNGE